MYNSYRDENISRLHTRALDLLTGVVQEAYDAPHPDGPIETGLIYRHANNIVWLAGDIDALIREGRIAGPPILARAMLESVFTLAAGTSVPNFAPRKAISELREWQQRLRNLSMFEPDELAEMNREAEKHICRIQKEYGVDSKDPIWTVSRCAQESGTVGASLRKAYFLMSQHTHSSSAGLLTRHTGSDVGIVHQSIISCLILGAAFGAQLLPVNDPQSIVDEASSLIRELTELVSGGAFEFDRTE